MKRTSRRFSSNRTASVIATAFLLTVVFVIWLAWTSYGPSNMNNIQRLTNSSWLTSLTMLTTDPLQPPQPSPISHMVFAFSQLSLAEAAVPSSHKQIEQVHPFAVFTPQKIHMVAPHRITVGWSLDTGTQNLESVIQASRGLNVLAPKWLHVDGPNGSLSSSIEPAVIAYAHHHGVKVWAVVDNGFNAQMTHAFLRYQDTQDRLINTLVALATKDHLDGINVDFEGLSSVDRWNYSRFITVLAKKMHAIHRTVTVDLPPDIVFAQNNGPYNHSVIAQAADDIIVMGYDEHWGGDAIAGPTASLPWVENAVADMLKTGVPARKLILGIPFYTQDWTINHQGAVLSSNALSLVQTNQLLSQQGLKMKWDSKLGVHFVRYRQNGVVHEIWLEDNRSLLLTLQLVARDNLGGAAAWYLGLEQPSIWSSLVMAVHAVSA